MVAINMAMPDPTLESVDAAIQARGRSEQARPYLGMSEIGRECSRALWYGFHWCSPGSFDAQAFKRFEDGHRGEALQAERLKMVQGVTLYTETGGKQFGFSDHGGHFRGHMDGVVLGLLQAPKTWHVWEHKQTDEKKQRALEKAKQELGEKQALKAWDPVYHAQAQAYMGYANLTRHYLTCATPGGRHTISVRTDADAEAFASIRDKALRVITAPEPLAKISERPDWYQCQWCSHHALCHDGGMPLVTCRTCIHSTPELDGDGRWTCRAMACDIDTDTQRQGAACPEHRLLPFLVPAEVVDFERPDEASFCGVRIKYRKPDGTEVWNGSSPGGYASREMAANFAAAGDPEADEIRSRFMAELIG